MMRFTMLYEDAASGLMADYWQADLSTVPAKAEWRSSHEVRRQEM